MLTWGNMVTCNSQSHQAVLLVSGAGSGRIRAPHIRSGAVVWISTHKCSQASSATFLHVTSRYVTLRYVTSCYVVMSHYIFSCATSPLQLTTTEEGSLIQLHSNNSGSCLPTTMPWLSQFFAGLLLWRPVFDSRPVQVGYVVDRVAMRQVSLQGLWFSPVTVFNQCSIFTH